MSIADKVIRLKQDIDEVYVTGYENGVEAGKQSGGSDYQQGYEDGKNSVVHFDRYIYSTVQFSTLNMFNTSEAVLNLDSMRTDGKGSLFNLFNTDGETEARKNITVEHLTINCPATVQNVQQMLYTPTANDEKLKRVTLNIDLKGCKNFANAFSGLKALEIVDGLPLDFSSNTNAITAFSRCYALTEFRVVPNTINKNFNIIHSNLLSTETIQSIIDGLADLNDSDIQTLSLHSTVLDRLTDEQYEQIFAKNWDTN